MVDLWLILFLKVENSGEKGNVPITVYFYYSCCLPMSQLHVLYYSYIIELS